MPSNESNENVLDVLFSRENSDIPKGLLVLVVGGILALVAQTLPILIGVGLGLYFLFTILMKLTAGEEFRVESRQRFSARANQQEIKPATSAPITDEPTIAERIKSVHLKNDFKCPACGATVLPTYLKCKHCGSVLVAIADLPRPERWGDIEIGQSVEVKHPIKGKMSLPIVHRVYYAELWQAQMRPNVPWTLTGSYYVGLGLGNDMFLMNWQSRFYLLDSKSALTDMDINRDFSQPARRFGASNQTADVRFQHKGITWRMEDIGRFRIEFVEGDGIRVSPGAVGRFIHASSNDKILAVEDYQSGGSGLDSLWTGYQIKEKDIQF